jgi:hypothetical protein
MKVIKPDNTSVHVVFKVGTMDFRLFHSTIKQAQNSCPDPQIRGLLERIDRGLTSPEAVSLNAPSAAPAPSMAPEFIASLKNHISGMNDRLNMVLQSISGLNDQLEKFGGAPTGNTAVSIEGMTPDVLDGWIKRLETVIHETVQDKVVPLGEVIEKTQLGDLQKTVDELKKQLQRITAAQPQIHVAAENTVIEGTKPQIFETAPKKEPETAPAPPKEEIKAEVVEPRKDPEPETVIPEPEESPAVVNKDLVRYPAKTKKKKHKPKCFGHFLSKEEDPESPCNHCAFVNHCQQEVQKTEAKAYGKPDCFANCRHDFECSACEHKMECAELSQ